MTLIYSQKQLRVTFTLTQSNASFVGVSGEAQGNTLQLSGLRMSAIIKGAGYPAWTEASIRIYGMAQADMNALAVQTVSRGKTGFLPNTVLIEANSGSGGWTAAYAGNILTAAPDYSAAPDVPLEIVSRAGLYDSVNPATPTSFPQSVSVYNVLSTITAKMNLASVNNGVTSVTSGAVYRPESLTDQLRAICQAYAIDPVYSADGHTITFSPQGSADLSEPLVLTPTTGLVGYPVPQANGFIAVRSLYNPALHVKSALTIADSDAVIDSSAGFPTTLNSLANGSWVVTAITNILEAQKPDGAWFSDLVLYPPFAVATPT
jgi:hypothetical protein